MEIEAKFAVSDSKTFRRLKSAKRLAGFVLSKGKTKRVRDTYLDSDDRRIFSAGYSYRRRVQARKILITLKALKTGTNGIHKREEFEITLPADLPPTQWRPSPMRKFVLGLTHGKSLVPLFDLLQTRTIRALMRDKRRIAELSLDRVRVLTRDQRPPYFEIECELLPAGNESDLAAIAKCLKEQWKLRPEPRSKFIRALEIFKTKAASGSLAPNSWRR